MTDKKGSATPTEDSSVPAEPGSGHDALSHAAAAEGLASLTAARAGCAEIAALVNRVDAARCGAKANALPHAGDHKHTGCKCTGTPKADFMTDVIVLIDTSGSMTGAASAVSAAAAAAVEAAKASCSPDLRIAYMGVEGVWAGTMFTTDYLAYLKALLNPDPAFATDNPVGGYTGEEGANAIEDLAKYYDWRPGACRAIFYISDEELDGSSPRGDTANEALSVADAVAAALANDVTIFAHHLTYQNLGASVIKNYNDLCDPTGGQAFFSAAPDKAEYTKILSEAICASCGKPRCQTAEIPPLEPCISVKWGDSKCDCFETDDTEIVCITVCNCYSNISFSNLTIAAVYVTTAGGGAVPILPDGTPSVQIVPLGPVCFGDIPPCRDDRPGCVSREFVIRTRGARSGAYEVHLAGICYDVCFHYDRTDVFQLTLCAD
jgi:hypothetical protein